MATEEKGAKGATTESPKTAKPKAQSKKDGVDIDPAKLKEALEKADTLKAALHLAKGEVNDLTSQRNALRDEVKGLKQGLANATSTAKNAQAAVATIRTERDKLKASSEPIKKQMQEGFKKLGDAEKRIEALEEELAKSKKKTAEAKRRFELQGGTMEQMQHARDKAQKERDSVLEMHDNTVTERDKARGRVKELTEEVEKLQAKLADTRKQKPQGAPQKA